jgi:MoaA/NifB/PqqE/SkfB family radical SAM enzyme
MNDINAIYAEFGKDICLCPFLGGFYQTNNVTQQGYNGETNSIRPCSLIRSDGQPWNITSDSILDTRNNVKWKTIRKQMLDGDFQTIHDCRTCTYTEKLGGTSPRMSANEFFVEFLNIDIISEVRRIIKNNLESDAVYALDYYPSNYCNYACIMCSGGASSKRHTMEVRLGSDQKIFINNTNADFYNALEKVQILNLTGGETILQKQAIELIDYLIEQDLAKNIVVTLLTNASGFPDKVYEKFKQFKSVLYTISVDGIGDVIEYQRRGCKWKTVEENAIQLCNDPDVHTIVNYVVTSVNILSAVDFIDWCYKNEIKFFTISPVVRVEYLGPSSLPMELRELALKRLRNALPKYQEVAKLGKYMDGFARGIEQLISTIENNPYSEQDYNLFLEHIKKEDAVSSRPLRECVPEWANYIP